MASFPMPVVPPLFAELFALAVDHSASDLHLKVGRPALVRVAGQLVETEMAPFTAAQLADFIEATLPVAFRARWQADHQVDVAVRRTTERLYMGPACPLEAHERQRVPDHQGDEQPAPYPVEQEDGVAERDEEVVRDAACGPGVREPGDVQDPDQSCQ